ncbi:hypothetical protein OG944_04115 [Streptomyces anulatus]|uniref:hypothetical protein n=1 Tax=Streptomyces anulatus TaxID=1892 RepID=UPI00386F37DD
MTNGITLPGPNSPMSENQPIWSDEFKDTEDLPPHQQTAIGEFIAMLDGAIEELNDEDGARA